MKTEADKRGERLAVYTCAMMLFGIGMGGLLQFTDPLHGATAWVFFPGLIAIGWVVAWRGGKFIVDCVRREP